MAGLSNWQFVDPFGVDVSMGARGGVKTPEAQYPDGYLTPMSWRRGKGAADSAPALAERDSYDRGVNKHTKLPPEDYFWASDFDLGTRLRVPVHAGPNRLMTVARQGFNPTVPDAISARMATSPGWYGSELSVHTDRPPWSPRA